jgi:hypothetical protein
MSFSSKPKKVKPKGTVRELKLVNTVNRRGMDTMQTEEVTTPRNDGQQNAFSASQRNRSSSPVKRQKLDDSDIDPILFNVEDPDVSKKRQTLVRLFPSWLKLFSNYSKGQNDYLRQFLDHEALYSKHLLNQEMPPTDPTCHSCAVDVGHYRCMDCYGPHWWCRTCLNKLHRHHPFHRPQQFKDGSFENISLSDLGYVFVLGHSSSLSRCPEDDNFLADRRMVLVHVNGVFEHSIRFCKCQGALSEHEQLFVHRLFPSTFNRPETAFTLDVLDYYGIDATECKTSAQSFFQKLRRVTNNAFPGEVPVSSPFHCISPNSCLTVYKGQIPGTD